jgi:hypothetical protein
MNKEVRFGSIAIREYAVVLGDNPACQSGPPLRYVVAAAAGAENRCHEHTSLTVLCSCDSLDWAYECTNECKVDDYETCRPPRKSQDDLYLPDAARWIMLLEKHSPVELDAVVLQVARLQRLRELARTCRDDEEEENDGNKNSNVKKTVVVEPIKKSSLLSSSTNGKKTFKTFFGRIVKRHKSSLKSKLRRHTSSSSTASTEDPTASLEGDDDYDMDDSVLDDGRSDHAPSVISEHDDDDDESTAREQPVEEAATTFAVVALEI